VPRSQLRVNDVIRRSLLRTKGHAWSTASSGLSFVATYVVAFWGPAIESIMSRGFFWLLAVLLGWVGLGSGANVCGVIDSLRQQWQSAAIHCALHGRRWDNPVERRLKQVGPSFSMGCAGKIRADQSNWCGGNHMQMHANWHQLVAWLDRLIDGPYHVSLHEIDDVSWCWEPGTSPLYLPGGSLST
jgi:hypothetical protein